MRYLTKNIFIPVLFIFDLIGSIILFWRRFKKKPSVLNKALFIRLEHIGDMVMATPAFESFKKSNPHCRVHVLCRKLTAELIKNNPYVDKIITYDAPWFIKRDVSEHKKLRSVIKQIRREQYDIVFEMHGDPRNNYIAFRTGAYSVGYGCRGGGFLLNMVTEYDSKIHMIDQNLKLISPYCSKLFKGMQVYTDGAAREAARSILNAHSLKSKSYIIINPLSGRKEKDLTDFEVNKFIKKYSAQKILITGSKSESDYNKRFEHYSNIVNITGETGLMVLAELVRDARIVIAPDTGIIHIARAVGTDLEAVYKTTDKKVWGY